MGNLALGRLSRSPWDGWRCGRRELAPMVEAESRVTSDSMHKLRRYGFQNNGNRYRHILAMSVLQGEKSKMHCGWNLVTFPEVFYAATDIAVR